MSRTKVQLLVLCAMSVIVLTMQSETTCDDNTHVNGCSIPFETAFKKRFTPACNKHDICYNCLESETFSISRLQCDERFWENMRRTCQSITDDDPFEEFLQRELCKTHADAYFTAVRVLGESHVAEETPSWCELDWVKPCMT